MAADKQAECREIPRSGRSCRCAIGVYARRHLTACRWRDKIGNCDVLVLADSEDKRGSNCAMEMINPASVAFDIDGVVADTMSLFLEIVRDVHNINSIQYEDICCYDLVECTGLDQIIVDSVIERLLAGNYSASLNPMAGAAAVLTRIASHHSPLLFVTARPYLGPIREWLLDLLPLKSRSIDIITTGSYKNKADVLLERKISCFVEDRIDTCDLMHDVGILPILYKQPWNRVAHAYQEINSWKELEALIDFKGI